jgi:hypothetical protein
MILGKEIFSSTAGSAKMSHSVQMTTWMPVQVRTMGTGLYRHFRKFCNFGSKLKASKIFRDFIKMQETQRVKLTPNSVCLVLHVKSCGSPMKKPVLAKLRKWQRRIT